MSPEQVHGQAWSNRAGRAVVSRLGVPYSVPMTVIVSLFCWKSLYCNNIRSHRLCIVCIAASLAVVHDLVGLMLDPSG